MKLAVAEQFYSIQGEGRYSGTPAIFLRLAGCNLLCGGLGTDKDGQLHSGATWRCDTIEVWRKGKLIEPAALIAQWEELEYLSYIGRGAHLVITGGEPLLQQDAIQALLGLLEEHFSHQFIEIETNGTLTSTLDSRLILNYNCSPKLANSGMEASARAVKIHESVGPASGNLDLKFVISTQTDILEVMQIVSHTMTPSSNVYLMPATDSRDTLITLSEMVVGLCLEHDFNFSSRHQVMVWDRTTGV